MDISNQTIETYKNVNPSSVRPDENAQQHKVVTQQQQVIASHQDARTELKRRGLALVLSGPSGAGKSTVSSILLSSDPHVKLSVSFTTRPMRAGEINGVHYHFVSRETFLDKIARNCFVEYANVMGHYYGTSRSAVVGTLSEGCDLLFDIDWQGHRQLRACMSDDVVSIFILPPKVCDLKRRLIARNQDDPETIERRMNCATIEISRWHEYDYVIINDDMAKAMEKVLHILRAERLKKNRRLGLEAFVNDICSSFISA